MPRGRQIRAGGHGSRVKTIAWRNDPVILQRIEIVGRFWNEGKRGLELTRLTNEVLEAKGLPPVSKDTIRRDTEKLAEIGRELNADAQIQHSEHHRHALDKIYERIAELRAIPNGRCPSCGRTGTEQAEAALWSVLQRTLSEWAKVDGAMVLKTETKVQHTATEAVKVLVLQVLPKYVAEDVIVKVLDDPDVRKLEAPHE